jgi:F-type H+-transporting ATPase subunit b
MFDLNLTFFIFVGMFLVFIKLLSEMVLKPVGKVLEQRQAIIRTDVDAAAAARARANEVVTDYQARIHHANAEAQALITEVTTAAEKTRAAELKKVQDKGQAEIQAAREKLKAERGGLIDQLVDQEKSLVESITKKLIGDNATVNLDSGTIKRALEEAR